MLKKLWNDPVWSKVIAGVILAIGATFATFFFDWSSMIGKFVAQCYAFIVATTPIPNWVLLLIAILALPTVIFFGAVVWQKAFPSRSTASSWKNYTTDFFFGLRWRWRYRGEGLIYDMHTFCRHCDFQVYAQDVSSYRVIDHLAFRCDSCGCHLAEFQEAYASIESKTKRFIQQKIRNGTWSTQNSA